MATRRLIYKDREEWLEKRKDRIGGSDAAAILGLNPWMDNQKLWRIKAGLEAQEDISDKPCVKYGNNAEKYIRALFALDYPQYTVDYFEDNMWVNDDLPFAHASLDGELTDETGRKGILEIKTTEIMSQAQRHKWDGGIPDNYYCQVLHYFAVTGFDFAVLHAQMKYQRGDDCTTVRKTYHIERADVLEDIEYLIKEEKRFWQYIQERKEPNLILPVI